MPIKYLVMGNFPYESYFKVFGVFDTKEAAEAAMNDIGNVERSFNWEVIEVTHYAL